MREYRGDLLVKIVCNRCKMAHTVSGGAPTEAYFQADADWGYFSGKDGEHHSFDLCEACYDAWTADFLIPPAKDERTELV